MNVEYAIYDTATGRIKYKGSVPEFMLEAQAALGGLYVGEVDFHTDYIVAGVKTARPVSPVTLAGTTLSNVPVPAKVRVNAMFYDTTDSTVELTLPALGTYSITVIAFPYLDKSFTVTT
jgi:hypothetical protein